MTKLRECLLLFMLINLQVTVSRCDGIHIDIFPEQSETMKSVSININQERSLDNTTHEDQMTIKNVKRTIRSALNDSYGLQYEQICRASGNQPCTCYYPDHPDVVQFQLGKDEITTNATKVNGTGPSSCEDLKKSGHFLNGFYMIHFNTKRVKATYCVFNETSENYLNTSNHNSFNQISRNQSSSKVIRFCGGVKGKLCPFYYSDNPDSPQLGFKFSNEKYTMNGLTLNITRTPASCKDLQLLGHFLNGFYMIHFNTVKVKIVYCSFKSLENSPKELSLEQDTEKSNNFKSCNGVGSQPCSCYMSNHPKILQFELSNDETTRSALLENSTGPGSCNDLTKIGHTLDGFYMVREHSKMMKTVFCKLRQKEKQKLDEVTTTEQTTSKPAFFRPDTKKVISRDYFSNAKVFPPCIEFGISLHLINKHGLCLAVKTKGDIHVAQNGDRIIQSDCNPLEKGQLWKGNGNRLCNDWNKCISTSPQQKPGSKTSFVVHWELKNEDQRQQFHGNNENNLINLRNCLGIKNDANYSGAEAKTGFCNEKEQGQIWQFANIEYNQNKDYKNAINCPHSELVESNVVLPTTIPNSNDHNTKLITNRIQTQISSMKDETKNNQQHTSLQTTIGYPKNVPPNQIITASIQLTSSKAPYENIQTSTTFNLRSQEKEEVLESKDSSFRQLKNGHGMCLAVETNGFINPSQNGALIIQSDCNSSEKGQYWKVTNDFHLCNQWNKCLSIALNDKPGKITSIIIHDEHKNSEHQDWVHGNNGILYNKGRCLAIENNKRNKGAAVQSNACNFGLEGQIWTFCSN